MRLIQPSTDDLTRGVNWRSFVVVVEYIRSTSTGRHRNTRVTSLQPQLVPSSGQDAADGPNRPGGPKMTTFTALEVGADSVSVEDPFDGWSDNSDAPAGPV